MGSADLAERSALAQHMCQQRIVVEHIRRPRMVAQTLLQIRDRPSQSRLWKWIEEIEHDGLGREGELSRVAANCFEREALLRFASVLGEVLLRSLMQCRQKFNAHDAAKGIIRRHQQRASFARAEIDEDEVAKVGVSLFTQSFEHLVKQASFCRLIRRVEDSEKAIAPTYSGAGGVDAVIPIVVSIAVALTPPLWSGV